MGRHAKSYSSNRLIAVGIAGVLALAGIGYLVMPKTDSTAGEATVLANTVPSPSGGGTPAVAAETTGPALSESAPATTAAPQSPADVLGQGSLPAPSAPVSAQAPAPPAKPACPERGTLRVAAASGMSAVVKSLADAACVDLKLTTVDGPDGAAQLAAGKVDVWIPSSKEHAIAAGTKAADAAPSTATSPVVMAAGPKTAAALTKGKMSFPALLVKAPAGVTIGFDATPGSSVSLALAGFLTQVATKATGDKYIGLAGTAQALVALKPVMLSGPIAEGQVAIVEQRSLTVGGAPLGTVIPTADGVPTLSYPWLTGPKLDQSSAAAGKRLLEALLGAPGQAARKANGLQDPKLPAVDLLGGAKAPAVQPLDGNSIKTLYAMAGAGIKPGNTLAVVDVSGSMGDPVPNSPDTAMDGVKSSAQLMMAMLNPQTKVGLWRFGNQLGAPEDHLEMVPIAPMASNKTKLLGAIDELEPLPTGTALYNTTLAAYKHVQQNYDPKATNLVVLFTDGRDQDVQGGLDLARLTAELKKAADPTKPIGLLLFGFGQADTKAMEKMLAAVGVGGVWGIQKPEQIVGALLEATGQTANF